MKLKEANARAGLILRKAPQSETQRKLLAFERQIRKVDYAIIRVHDKMDLLLDALDMAPKNSELRAKIKRLGQRSKNFQAQKSALREAVREIKAFVGLPSARI